VADRFDRAKFAKLIAMVDSTFDAEALSALRLAAALLKAAGMTFGQVINAEGTDAINKARIANEAAEILAAQLSEAQAEIDRLRRAENSRGTAVAIWQNVSAKISNNRATAQWALDLYDRSLVWLSSNERDLLTKIATGRWVGQLTGPMQRFFRSTIDRIVQKTGLVPPS
jgi:hypothetical protein